MRMNEEGKALLLQSEKNRETLIARQKKTQSCSEHNGGDSKENRRLRLNGHSKEREQRKGEMERKVIKNPCFFLPSSN